MNGIFEASGVTLELFNCANGKIHSDSGLIPTSYTSEI